MNSPAFLIQRRRSLRSSAVLCRASVLLAVWGTLAPLPAGAERAVTDWTEEALKELPALNPHHDLDEDSPSQVQYAAALAPPPGTPVLQATDGKALEQNWHRPVIVKCVLTGTRSSPVPGTTNPDGSAFEKEEVVLQDSPLFLNAVDTPAARFLFGADLPPVPAGEKPAPRTVFVAGILQPDLNSIGGAELRPGITVYSFKQIAETPDAVRFPWQTRPWFASEWKPNGRWLPVPASTVISGDHPGPAVRLRILQMRPDAVAAMVVPVAGCFSPSPGGERFVSDSGHYGMVWNQATPWQATIYRELERQAAARKKWPKGHQLSLVHGSESLSPWGAPDEVQAAGSAIVIEALLARLTLRTDVAFAATMEATGKLQPCRLLAERLSAARAAGITTVIVAANSEAELTTAAHVLGAAAFTQIRVIGAATVADAAALASEAGRARLDAIAARFDPLAKVPPVQLLSVLTRDAAARELNGLAQGVPPCLSALVLRKAGRKEVPLEPLAAMKPGAQLPPVVSRARLAELLSWDFSQYRTYQDRAVLFDLQDMRGSTIVFNSTFGAAVAAAVGELQPRLAAKYAAAGKAGLDLARAAASLKPVKQMRAAGPVDPAANVDTSLTSERAAFQAAFDLADGKKPVRKREAPEDGIIQ